MKEFAEENYKFDENCRKFSERLDNTVGKGEIGPTVFPEEMYCRHLGLVWERVKRPKLKA